LLLRAPSNPCPVSSIMARAVHVVHTRSATPAALTDLAALPAGRCR
jgi:hypothetical protein